MMCTCVHSPQDEMARGGLRTLVISQREVSAQEYTAWQEEYAVAQASGHV
jgi:hypothetical protein